MTIQKFDEAGHPDTSEFDALSPKMKVYVDALAKQLYLCEGGWEDVPNSRFWEQELEGYRGEQSLAVVMRHRAVALYGLRALVEAQPTAEAA